MDRGPCGVAPRNKLLVYLDRTSPAKSNRSVPFIAPSATLRIVDFGQRIIRRRRQVPAKVRGQSARLAVSQSREKPVEKQPAGPQQGWIDLRCGAIDRANDLKLQKV